MRAIEVSIGPPIGGGADWLCPWQHELGASAGGSSCTTQFWLIRASVVMSLISTYVEGRAERDMHAVMRP